MPIDFDRRQVSGFFFVSLEHHGISNRLKRFYSIRSGASIIEKKNGAKARGFLLSRRSSLHTGKMFKGEF
jgi:hypothetical protein